MVERLTPGNTVEIDGETFILDTDTAANASDEDVVDFFDKYWLKEHPELDWQDPLHRNSPQKNLSTSTHIEVLCTEDGKVVAMSIRDPYEAEDNSFGMVAVHPKYRRRGIARFFIERQHAMIKKQDPGKAVIEAIAQSMDGLMTILAMEKRKSFPERLDIQMAPHVVMELALDIFEKFSDEAEFRMLNIITDLDCDGKLKFELSEQQQADLCKSHGVDSIDEINAYDVCAFLLEEEDPKTLLEMAETDDIEEVRRWLITKGIIVG